MKIFLKVQSELNSLQRQLRLVVKIQHKVYKCDVLCHLLRIWQQFLSSKHDFDGPAQKRNTKSDLQSEQGERKQAGEKKKDGGGEIESRDKCALCYWATPAPMDSQQDSKPLSASNRSHEDIFFFKFPKKHIYLFHVTLPFVCLFLSALAPLTLLLKPC